MMNKLLPILMCVFAFCASGCAKDWIPKDAKVVYSSSQHDGFLPDGTVKLKIKTTEEAFNKARSERKLTLHTEDRKYTQDKDPWLSWAPELDGMLEPVKGENRWNPTWDLSRTYVRQEGDTWEFMKYENGYIFYCWLNH